VVGLIGESRNLVLRADGHGHWWDGEGGMLPALEGCVDLDISATPFTNTLPIRRLGLSETESREIRAAYISVPDLSAVAVEQRYTCLSLNRIYRYEGLFRGFVTELSVDEDGFVTDYPGLFARITM
jgi:uncharacterized protein